MKEVFCIWSLNSNRYDSELLYLRPNLIEMMEIELI